MGVQMLRHGDKHKRTSVSYWPRKSCGPRRRREPPPKVSGKLRPLLPRTSRMNRMIAAQLRKRPEPRMDLKCSVCWKIWKHLLKRKRTLSVGSGKHAHADGKPISKKLTHSVLTRLSQRSTFKKLGCGQMSTSFCVAGWRLRVRKSLAGCSTLIGQSWLPTTGFTAGTRMPAGAWVSCMPKLMSWGRDSVPMHWGRRGPWGRPGASALASLIPGSLCQRSSPMEAILKFCYFERL
mmetsp:Transcript_41141/g.98134  ORF Transcript_41141/g.98134 Transcript_41141/m.98134 type:complete len:235 (+) Transcript_41141:633-1337(+)